MIAIEGGSFDDLFIHRVSPESRCRADPTRRGTRESDLSASSLVCLFCCGSVRLGSAISTLGMRGGFESDLGIEKKLVKIDKRGCVFPGLVPLYVLLFLYVGLN